MIKTDRAIYRTRTPEEYDWLMDKLEEAECEWQGGGSPISGKSICDLAKSDSYIWIDNKTISFLGEDCWDYYRDAPGNKYDEFIEVSELMEDEDETEILDKLEDLKRIEDEFKNLCEQYDEQKDKTQKIKKIVYTTEVYFE